ncbi:MAG: hypothetical protein ABIS28_18255 [Caldimonas sp.]
MPMSAFSKSLWSVLTASPIGAGGTASLLQSAAVPQRDAGAWRGRLKSWLGADVGECCESTLHSLKPSTRRKTALLDARTAFRAAIDDIPRSAGAGTTLEHIRASRSLHALWELRNELFSLISCHHDQGEAARRIAALDRLFSGRLRRAASKKAALQGSC